MWCLYDRLICSIMWYDKYHAFLSTIFHDFMNLKQHHFFHYWLSLLTHCLTGKKSIHCAGCINSSIVLKFWHNGNCAKKFSGHHSTSMVNFHPPHQKPSHADALNSFENWNILLTFFSWLDNFFYLSYKLFWWFCCFLPTFVILFTYLLFCHFVDLTEPEVPICTQQAAKFSAQPSICAERALKFSAQFSICTERTLKILAKRQIFAKYVDESGRS